MRRDYPLSAERHSAPERDVPVEEFIALLNANKISHGVLTAPSFYGSDNTILLQALATEPARLRGTIIVESDIDISTLDGMKLAGVAGIRLNWVKRRALPDVSSLFYQRLMSAVKHVDMHVEIYIEGDLLPVILPNIQKSGVKIVLDHFGCPNPDTRMESEGFALVLDSLSAGNTWIKLSAPYRLGGADPQPYVDAFLEVGGANRLLWASDWPWIGHETTVTYQQCKDWLSKWIPDRNTRDKILADNPRELFGFEQVKLT